MSSLPEKIAAGHHCCKETSGIGIADFCLCGTDVDVCLSHSGICRLTMPAQHPSNTTMCNECNSSRSFIVLPNRANFDA